MSGFKDKTWKKWKANKTTSPVTVTDKKSSESISSQRSSSLVRSRKRRTTRDAVDDIGFFKLAAENRGKPITRPLVECGENKLATTENKDRYDADHKNDFRDKTTSPFNTLAPTNPFCRENTIIVQYGELDDNAKSPSDSGKPNELWGELPSTEVAASPKPQREKGPKGGSKRPASPRKSRHKTSTPPGSLINKKSQRPATPQAHPQPASQPPPQAHAQPPPPAPLQAHAQPPPQALPQAHAQSPPPARLQAHAQPPPPAPLQAHAQPPPQALPQAHAQPAPQAPPHADSGPSVSHDPRPHSGQPQRPRTSPSSDPRNGLCDFPECPARGPKQKERLCMAPECPVTMKKTVVKEAKRAMKRSCGKKRKNPLTFLGAILMSAFAGNNSACKLTKEEKKAFKRMKAEEEDDDSSSTSEQTKKKTVGVQCKAPISKDNDRPQKGPSKADKSTSCDIPECPIVKQKTKIKEFMDKGQLCDFPRCPVREPPPRKEPKVEPPKGCPAKPCTLKIKDEEFLKSLGPAIYEKIPRLKMTCDEAHADGNHGQSRPRHAQPAVKNKDKPPADRAKDKDKGVKIIAAHVHVPPPSENPFQSTITNPREFPGSSEPTKRLPNENHVSSVKESECQKLVSRRLSAPDFISEAEADEFECARPVAANLRMKDKYVVASEDGTASRRSPSNISVNHQDSLRMKGTPTNEPIESFPAYFLAYKSSKTTSDIVHAISHQEILLNSGNGLKTTQSNLLSMSTNDPTMTDATSEQALKNQTVKNFPAPITGAKKTRSKETEMHPFNPIPEERPESANVEGTVQNFQAPDSNSLIRKSNRKRQKSDLLLELKDNWRAVTVLPVKYQSTYSATSNHILKDPFDLRTPKETSNIKLLQRNWNTLKNSKASLSGEKNSLLSMGQSINNKNGDISAISTADSSDENFRQRSVANITSPSMKIVSGFKFSENIDEPLVVERSEFDDNRFQEMSLKIFVAEPAIAIDIPKNIKPGSDRDHCLFDAMSEAENSARILDELNEAQCTSDTAEPSRKIKYEDRVCQDTKDNRKPRRTIVLPKNTLQFVEQDEGTGESSSIEKSTRKPIAANRVSIAESDWLENSEVSNETCTQTLATSAVSPNDLNTIGVGSNSTMGLRSQHLFPR